MRELDQGASRVLTRMWNQCARTAPAAGTGTVETGKAARTDRGTARAGQAVGGTQKAAICPKRMGHLGTTDVVSDWNDQSCRRIGAFFRNYDRGVLGDSPWHFFLLVSGASFWAMISWVNRNEARAKPIFEQNKRIDERIQQINQEVQALNEQLDAKR